MASPVDADVADQSPAGDIGTRFNVDVFELGAVTDDSGQALVGNFVAPLKANTDKFGTSLSYRDQPLTGDGFAMS